MVAVSGWRLAVGGWEHTETGGRGEATPLPEAALRRPYVVTRSRPYPRQRLPTQRENHFRWQVAAPGGGWRAICHLSSVIDAVIDSALYSALHSALYAVLNSVLCSVSSYPLTANR